MCSSLAREYSIESTAVAAGFFTRGLTEGLSGKADLNGDGYVYLHELDLYARARVRQLSDGMQNTTTAKESFIV